MIVVSDKTEAKFVFVPRNSYTESDENYVFTLVDRGTNKEYPFNVLDEHGKSWGFYSFQCNFSDIPNGEYEYSVDTSAGSRVATGIIRINALEQDDVCYEPKFTYDTTDE